MGPMEIEEIEYRIISNKEINQELKYDTVTRITTTTTTKSKMDGTYMEEWRRNDKSNDKLEAAR